MPAKDVEAVDLLHTDRSHRTHEQTPEQVVEQHMTCGVQARWFFQLLYFNRHKSGPHAVANLKRDRSMEVPSILPF